MNKRYASLTIALTLIAMVRALFLEPGPVVIRSPIPRDAESLVAAGEKIPFAEAGVYELQLIPGLQEKHAFEIEKRREEIAGKCARGVPISEALQEIKGIGPKTAKLIEGYVEAPGCEGTGSGKQVQGTGVDSSSSSSEKKRARSSAS